METFQAILKRYQAPIDRAICGSFETFGPPSKLREAMEYALKNGGKRFRPAIVYLVASALGSKSDVTEAALAVEFFHTASLIADDLPCMDDETHRRGTAATHRVFGEATAILATYALISAGYERIGSSSLAVACASRGTGILGATGGQFLDLYPDKLGEAEVLDIIDKKTGTLFEISFVFGWIFGGGDLEKLPLLKTAAYHFGRAFQISDDFLDLKEDQEEGRVNYPAIAGVEKAARLLDSELESLQEALEKLGLNSPELLKLVELVKLRQQQALSSQPPL